SPADNDPVVAAQRLQELGQIKWFVWLDRRGDERLEELGGDPVALLQLAAATLVGPRRQVAGAAAQLGEEADRVTAGRFVADLEKCFGQGVCGRESRLEVDVEAADEFRCEPFAARLWLELLLLGKDGAGVLFASDEG